MICASCYYQGEPKTITRGSFAIELVLWIFFFWAFLIPPLVYSIWRLTTRAKVCPKCGQATLISENSPRGIELTKKHSLKGRIEYEVIPQPFNLESPSKKPTGKAWMLLLLVPLVVAIIGWNSNSSSNSSNTQESQYANTLVKYEVESNVEQGTLGRVTVIIPNAITKEQMIALNDKLSNDYSKGLTHLFIDYFDDKEVSVDYFKKVSNVTEKESDEMTSHYRAKYVMNKTTGYNELEFNENNNMVALKKY